MAKASGKTREKTGGKFVVGDDNYKGKIGKVESLKTIQTREVYNSVKDAIARFHSVLGVRQRNIKLADLDEALGVHVTKDGQSAGVYLNKSFFQPSSVTTQSIAKTIKDSYDTGFLTRTNQPISHVVSHELAHALWNTHLTTKNALEAAPEIKALYRQWVADKSKKSYGAYASSSLGEWFAETTVKAVHGSSDEYTRKLKEIIKKHNL